MSGDDPSLPSDVINIDSGMTKSFKVIYLMSTIKILEVILGIIHLNEILSNQFFNPLVARGHRVSGLADRGEITGGGPADSGFSTKIQKKSRMFSWFLKIPGSFRDWDPSPFAEHCIGFNTFVIGIFSWDVIYHKKPPLVPNLFPNFKFP